MGRPKISKLKYEKIIQMLSEGYTYKDIAKKHKVHYQFVTRLSVENGMRRTKRHSKEEILQIIESIHADIKNGIPYKELLDKHDLINKKKFINYKF
jgi:DNA invertase Pin-like site-specific DNA recombinase